MAHADMAEGVEYAFVAKDTVGDCKVGDQIGQAIRHGLKPSFLAATRRLPSATP